MRASPTSRGMVVVHTWRLAALLTRHGSLNSSQERPLSLVTVGASDHSLELVEADRRASMLLQIEIVDRVADHADYARSPLAESPLTTLKE